MLFPIVSGVIIVLAPSIVHVFMIMFVIVLHATEGVASFPGPPTSKTGQGQGQGQGQGHARAGAWERGY